MAKPIISADSHITEPPDTYTARIERRFKDRAPHVVHDPKRGDLFVIDGHGQADPDGPRRRRRQARRGADQCSARASRTCTAAAGTRTRASPTRTRDGVAAEILYPTVGMMLCNHPDFEFKQACFDAYNLWIAEYCAAHPDRLLGVGPDRGALGRRRHPRPRADEGPRAPGRDDAGQSRRSPTTTTRCTTRSGRRRSISACRCRFHILTSQQDTFKTRGPEAQRVHVDHPRLPGHHRHVHLQRRVRAPPEAQARVRRGRRGLDTPLHVPHGPRVGASPLLADRQRAHPAAERVLPRARLHHVPGRLGGLPGEGPLQHPPAHVGERLPAQRFHVAELAGGAGRSRPAHLTEEERDLILHDNVAELYGLGVGTPTGGGAS